MLGLVKMNVELPDIKCDIDSLYVAPANFSELLDSSNSWLGGTATKKNFVLGSSNNNSSRIELVFEVPAARPELNDREMKEMNKTAFLQRYPNFSMGLFEAIQVEDVIKADEKLPTNTSIKKE